jgi:hypothetical protein
LYGSGLKKQAEESLSVKPASREQNIPALSDYPMNYL